MTQFASPNVVWPKRINKCCTTKYSFNKKKLMNLISVLSIYITTLKSASFDLGAHPIFLIHQILEQIIKPLSSTRI